MLDLSVSPRTINGVTVAADSADPDILYVVPGKPRPGMVDSAPASRVPDVHLLRFVRDGALTGGYLRLAIDLGLSDASLAAATETVTADPARAANPGGSVNLSPLPLVAAQADLAFYGRAASAPGAAPAPLVLTRYGTSLLELNAPHRGVFAISLTADGVRLVEAGLRSGELPVGVSCRLTAEGLWPSVQVTARVDWHSVYDHFSTDYQLGTLLYSEDVAQLMQSLTQSGAVRVSAVQSAAPGTDPAATDAAVANALAFVQTNLLDRFCQPVLPLSTNPAQGDLGHAGEVLDLGGAFEVKAITQFETAVGFYDLSQSSVVRRQFSTQATLGDLLSGADPAGFISDAGVEDPFFKQFHLDCHTARPLAESQLAEVVLDVGYGTSTGSIRLTPDSPTGGFDSFADASPSGSWTVTPRVTFAADSPIDPGVLVSLPPVTGTARDLSLDLDAALGLVRLDIDGTGDPRVQATVLSVTESPAGVDRDTRQLGMTPDAPTATAWFRDHRDGDTLTVAGKYLLTDGRQVPIAPALADTSRFRLPNPFAGTMTVQIVTDPVWTDLSSVVVAIQKTAADPVRTFPFSAPGSVAVALDLTDPTDRTYRYQVRRVVAGVSQDDPWLSTDSPLLSAGVVSSGELVVDVEPVGSEPPAVGLRLVQVDLLYVDVAHQLRAEHTHLIEAKADSYHWQVALADPTQRTYQYRITKQLLTGSSVAGNWTSSADPILPVAITAN